ncbi:hypothetical protein VHEMI07611 [[Torrubiella] hemipterigena]|uniref:Major facilitator superfamily (MFS) profile domain-containing protein n=1 Tax=[Torrubiella] hemipterigena TaxID=1531966 RepID=A0A0A1TAX2_9HYPO|nr:hypothetical protein VHEMI07611 [[Torrubiella] hemipterigena]
MDAPISPASASVVEPVRSNSEKTQLSKWHQAGILTSAFVINCTAGGILFSFGIYQALYESMSSSSDTDNPFAGSSPAQIGIIGSLSGSMMAICAPFAVAWAKHFNPRAVICAGGLLFGLSNILASFGTTVWHFQLSQGLLLGIAECLSYLPSMAVAPTWFSAHRGVAIGTISAGTGIGGLIWSPITTACIDRFGFRDTLRLTGALSAVLIFAAGFVLRWEPSMVPELQADKDALSLAQKVYRVPLPTRELAKQRKFIGQALGAAFQGAAYYIPTFFLAAYARTLRYSDQDGSKFITVNNACNAIGKITIGLIADRLGRLNTMCLSTSVTVLSLGLWISSTVIGQTDQAIARSLFISFTVFYGLFASSYVSLFSPTLVELFGRRQLPFTTGFMYLVQGLTALAGTPIAGVLAGSNGNLTTSFNYLGVSLWVGGLLFATSVTTIWVRIEAAAGRKHGQSNSWKL